MFLAFQIGDIIRIPFGYILDWLYQLTTNYGVSLILFAIVFTITYINLTFSKNKVQYM